MAEAGVTADDGGSVERHAGEAPGSRPRPDNPFAELADLWARVDPGRPHQSYRLIVCAVCGVASGWADVWAPGKKGLQSLNAFQESHRVSTASGGPFGSLSGHNRWQTFDINRQLS